MSIFCCFQMNRQPNRRITFQCSLLLLVFIYAFVGGLVFDHLEANALERHKKDQLREKTNCVSMVLNSTQKDDIVDRIVQCWAAEKDERSEWGYMTAWLYGFGICTTLGYNRIAPITTKGRLFCIVYGVVGIPMTMIIIANVGQYLKKFIGNCRKKVEIYRSRRRESKIEEGQVDDVQDASIEYVSIALLLVFFAYIALGAWLLPLLNGQIDFVNGLYYNFLCLTAMDFGQLVPQRVAFLPITFLYVCLGLAITTIAIEVGSEYMRKLHYFGQRVKNVATTKIWFGSKHLKVKELLHAVGRKCNVEPHVIDGLDLDNVVERAIAFNEGRNPPEDTNDVCPSQEPQHKSSSAKHCQTRPLPTPPREPSPPRKPSEILENQTKKLSIKQAILRTLSNSTVPEEELVDLRFNENKLVPLAESEAPLEEQDCIEPIVVTDESLVQIEEPTEVQMSIPVVLLDQPKQEACKLMEPPKQENQKLAPQRSRARSHSPFTNDEVSSAEIEEQRNIGARNSIRPGDGLGRPRGRSILNSPSFAFFERQQTPTKK
ncbi:hypothetical protein QR680_003744 [Steinernema hermaphroditum]|uniref:Potassium channel domain-containing protein n=1 Tax=Steinernema hermaphroditum TaxID=289476 RepID=A0AA39HME6_9BILA|nr:hypothetical protein QR680_003744 [Steinernema hermaphroditum]